MAIRILNNGIQIGNFLLQETKDGLLFNGQVTAKSYFRQRSFQGYNSGFIAAGEQSAGTPLTSVERFPFAAATFTGTSVLTLTTGTTSFARHGGHSSATHGYMSGGTWLPPATTWFNSNLILKFPFAVGTITDATTVGQLYSTPAYNQPRIQHSAHSSTTYGWIVGGVARATPSGDTFSPITTYIQRFPFAYDNWAEETIGQLTLARAEMSSHNSQTHGYACGGVDQPTVYRSVMDKFPFAAGNYNTTNIGNLAIARGYGRGHSSSTHGYSSGGAINPGASPVNSIERFPFAVDGNSQALVATLTQARWGQATQSSTNEGFTSGGSTTTVGSITSASAAVDKFPFGTDINAFTTGTLTSSRIYASGHQY